MSITVLVPTPLQKYTKNEAEVTVDSTSISGLIEDLETKFPGIKERICDESGKPRRFLNIYVNGEDIRFLDNLDTTIKDNDEISIVPAVAGG